MNGKRERSNGNSCFGSYPHHPAQQILRRICCAGSALKKCSSCAANPKKDLLRRKCSSFILHPKKDEGFAAQEVLILRKKCSSFLGFAAQEVLILRKKCSSFILRRICCARSAHPKKEVQRSAPQILRRFAAQAQEQQRRQYKTRQTIQFQDI
jgi:hypothetical protein